MRVIVIKITNARTSIIGLLTDVAPVRHRCHIYIVAENSRLGMQYR